MSIGEQELVMEAKTMSHNAKIYGARTLTWPLVCLGKNSLFSEATPEAQFLLFSNNRWSSGKVLGAMIAENVEKGLEFVGNECDLNALGLLAEVDRARVPLSSS